MLHSGAVKPESVIEVVLERAGDRLVTYTLDALSGAWSDRQQHAAAAPIWLASETRRA